MLFLSSLSPSTALWCPCAYKSSPPPRPHLAPDRRRQRNHTREQPLSTRLALENKKMKISRQTSNFSGVCGSALKCTGAHELHLLCTAATQRLGMNFSYLYMLMCRILPEQWPRHKGRIRDPQFRGGSQFQSPLKATGAHAGTDSQTLGQLPFIVMLLRKFRRRIPGGVMNAVRVSQKHPSKP